MKEQITISSIIRELWKFSAIEPFSGKVCNIHHQYRYHDRIYCLPSANEELALLFPDEQENPKNLDPSSEHNEVSPVEEFHTPGYSPTFILGGASSEGRVFVRQNLEKGQLIVQDTGFNAKRYSHSKVLRYDEGLRGTIQYWIRRRAELDKVSENDFLCILRRYALARPPM
ncbi:hypothetical protein RIR_jg11657.t1 [Rhizophagus irregularis DAOM 181602=DAOM 197198]|nr:hypothetical protein RIR_jg11657.t1 [Rhizophagus irregularis DAOM 181602=DAOM 197198]CAB4493248.1 unnamed protein product [Rhizophagus irregularis]